LTVVWEEKLWIRNEVQEKKMGMRKGMRAKPGKP